MLLKVATPLEAARVSVPPSVAPVGLVERLRVMLPAKVVTVWPPLQESLAVTVIDGLIEAVGFTLLGCWLKTSEATAPGLTAKLELVAPVSPLAEAARV